MINEENISPLNAIDKMDLVDVIEYINKVMELDDRSAMSQYLGLMLALETLDRAIGRMGVKKYDTPTESSTDANLGF